MDDVVKFDRYNITQKMKLQFLGSIIYFMDWFII